jgi:ribosomal protein L36
VRAPGGRTKEIGRDAKEIRRDAKVWVASDTEAKPRRRGRDALAAKDDKK